MTLGSQIQTDATGVFLSTDDFAESVLRYAGGLSGLASSVIAIVTWDPTDPVQDRGRANRRTGELFVASTQAVSVKDTFKTGTDAVQITAVGPIEHGGKTAYFKQYIPETKGATSVRTGDL